MKDRKTNVTSVILGIIVLIIAMFIVSKLITNIFKGNDSSDDKTSSKTVVVGDTFDNPIKIDVNTVKSLDGQKFVNKFKGKWIEFDGLIVSTSKLKDAVYPHTGLVVGNDPNGDNFEDSSLFQITSLYSTFGSDLEGYAQQTNAEELNAFPKVHVVAQVKDFNKDYLWVNLNPNSNIDGKKPSVTSR